MLVLKRKDGQWTEIKHAASGDVLRVRSYDVRPGHPGQVNLAFDDTARHFAITRPERKPAPEPAPAPEPIPAPEPTPANE